MYYIYHICHIPSLSIYLSLKFQGKFSTTVSQFGCIPKQLQRNGPCLMKAWSRFWDPRALTQPRSLKSSAQSSVGACPGAVWACACRRAKRVPGSVEKALLFTSFRRMHCRLAWSNDQHTHAASASHSAWHAPTDEALVVLYTQQRKVVLGISRL